MEQILSILGTNFSSFFTTNSVLSMIGGFLVFLFFFRSRIKTFMSFVFGQKFFLDDGAIARYNNRDVIYRNKKILLTRNINVKSFITIYLIFMTSLFSPFISVILFAGFMYIDSTIKLANFENFKFFDDDTFSDKFGTWLNENINKIDFISQNLIVFGIGSIILSIFTNSLFAGIFGVIALSTFLSIGLFLYYNIDSYKVNLKLNSYFKLTRLLSASLVGNSQILMFFFVITGLAYFHDSDIKVYLSIVSILNLGLILLFKMELGKATALAKEHLEIQNKDYADLANLGSNANPKSFARGNKWTTPLQLKEFSDRNNDGIVLDNFAFYHDALNRSILRRNPLLAKSLTNIQLKIKPDEFRKLLLLLGDMGSGKTQYINNIVTQNIKSDFKHYNIHIFNDIKGDFTSQLYRADKDIIISLFDKRASCWCVFTEMNYNIEAGSLFINNLFTTLAGGDKKFFENRAIQIICESIQIAYFETDNNIDAWNLFFEKIKDTENIAKEEDNGTNQSVLAVVQIALGILDILRYQICVEKRPTFTLTELVYKKDVQVFLLNNDNYRTRLTPYLNGVFASFVGAVMQKDDRVAKFENILGIWDEFLTLAMQLDDSTLTTLLTATRSKGLNNVLAMQCLPESGTIAEKIDSSYYGMVVFPVNKKFTLENITFKLGTQEALTNTLSPVKNKENGAISNEPFGGLLEITKAFTIPISRNKVENNKTYSLTESPFIYAKDIQSMPLYHHLTIIPKAELKCFDTYELDRAFRSLVFDGNIDCLEISEDVAKEVGMVYLGYTHPNNIDLGGEVLEAWDMKEYYLSKNQKIKESKKVQIFNDEELFTHYYKLKFVYEDDEIAEYCKRNRLDIEELENMFFRIEENAEKIAEFRRTHSKEEIKEIADKFFAIIDDKERYKFVVENNLFGCVLEGLLTDEEEVENEE